VQLPYNVSPLTTFVGGRIAQREGDVRRRIAQCATERERVYAALRTATGVEAFPSVTNFILFRLTGRTPAEVHAKFLEHSVLLRDISSWPGCAGCLRVSIGTPAGSSRPSTGTRVRAGTSSAGSTSRQSPRYNCTRSSAQ